MKSVDHAEVLRRLDYDPTTGVFVWRLKPKQGRVQAGQTAGNLNSNGYVRIKFDGVECLAHRLAWFYVHGQWPKEFIDHINGDRRDNRIANLREANNQQNHENITAAQSNSASGLRGVSYEKRSGKWRADIKTNGKQRTLGYYNSQDDAYAAYVTAKRAEHSFSTI